VTIIVNVLNLKICKVLKLDPDKVRSIQLNIKPYTDVTVNVETVVPGDQYEEVISIIKKYKLVDIEKEQ